MRKAAGMAVVLGLLFGLAAPAAWARHRPAPAKAGVEYVDITTVVVPGGPAVAQAAPAEPVPAK